MCWWCDVRGSAPGTRETDLLNPINEVDRVNAIVVWGGSTFGLNAATGAVRYLVSTGTGATVQKFVGMKFAMKSELGTTSLSLTDKKTSKTLTVAALVAVNALGDIFNSTNRQIIAGTRTSDGKHLLNIVQAVIDNQLPLCDVFNCDDPATTLATGKVDVSDVTLIGTLAAPVMERAIIRAVIMAGAIPGLPGANDLSRERIMTSLKLQLNKLADAHTQWRLSETDSQKRASFLYDPKVASTLDRETVYCLGVNGFEELCLIDSCFEEFGRVLFSDTSLTFERSIQTKEVNDSLNQTIKRFLIRLSPYFLLKPAHKALEWLVHRFYIHFYNVDDLIRCILPYHEHNYFVRAIQMLRFNSKHTTMWSWLSLAQKAGTTIPGIVLANRCATDFGFLNFVCEMISMAVKDFGPNHSSLRVMISFYLKTLCSTIIHNMSVNRKKNDIDENFISNLMPYVLKGLKSKCLLLKRATYLVLSHLSETFTFQQDVIEDILKVLAKGYSATIVKEGVLVTAVLLNKQNYRSLPERCFKKLCRLPNLLVEISQLTTEVVIDDLLVAFSEKLILFAINNDINDDTMELDNTSDSGSSTDMHENISYAKLLETAITDIKLNSNVLKIIIERFIEHYDEKQSYLISLASILERKYPVEFDSIIRLLVEQCLTDKERKRIGHFSSMTVTGFKHQPLSDRGSLIVCLNHSQTHLRIEALQRLQEGVKMKQIMEKEFLNDVLCSRLNDDEPMVVIEAVNLLRDLSTATNLASITVGNQLINDILQRNLQLEDEPEKNWLPVQQEIVRLLADSSLSVTGSNVVFQFFHLFFPTTQSQFKLLKTVLDKLKKTEDNQPSVLNIIEKCFKHVKSVKDLNNEFYTSFIDTLAKSEFVFKIIEQHDNILRVVDNNRKNKIKYHVIYISLAIEAIRTHLKEHQTLNMKHIELASVTTFKLLKKLHEEVTVTDERNIQLETKIDLNVIVQQQFEKSSLSSMSYTLLWDHFIKVLPKDLWFSNSFWNEFFDKCLRWLCSNTKKFSLSNVLSSLCHEQFVSVDKFFLFFNQHYLFDKLAQEKDNDFIYDMNCITSTIEQEHLLNYLCTQMKNKKQNGSFSNNSILTLFILLCSDNRQIRSLILTILKSLNDEQTADNETFFSGFLTTVKGHSNEIVVDQTYIRKLISQTILTELTTSKKSKKRKHDTETIIKVLKTTIDNEIQDNSIRKILYICLLLLLNDCKHWSIFEQFHQYLDEFIVNEDERLLSLTDRYLLTFIIKHINIETFEYELTSNICFETVIKILQQQQSKKKLKKQATLEIGVILLKQLNEAIFNSLSKNFNQQMQLIEECFLIWQRSKKIILITEVKATLLKFHFDAKHLKTFWQNIFDSICLDDSFNSTSLTKKLSNKKLISSNDKNETIKENGSIIKINWKKLIPSLELLHIDNFHVQNRHELIRPLFTILEKSINEDNSEQNTYIRQLCTTGLLDVYNRLQPNKYNQDSFQSEMIIECMKRANDLHTTQQCLLLLSKAAELFPEKLINMIMAMFAFVGDRLVRKDDLYSYQVMEKTIKTVIPSLYKEKNAQQRTQILAKISYVFVTSLAHLPAHRRQDIFRLLMESVGQDECLWFAPIQLFDSVLLSPLNKKNEDVLKKSLIDASEQMLASFVQFNVTTIIIALTNILRVVLELPDQAAKNNSTPLFMSHLMDIRSYTTKHIHVLKYQLITFVSNVLVDDYFIQLIKESEKLRKENIIDHINTLIECILRCVLWANKLADTTSATDDIQSNKYNKSVLGKTFDCLNKAISLLNGTMFVQVIQNLLQHQNEKIQRKAIDMMNNRFRDEQVLEKEV
ncbi:unnamed protein product [Didymodactylos carnosus]|uniref:HEAT repeat-containing protein 1 n=1 Tax=Didymodactylos carnosus TaxID=1234261 RepID=A0A8S2GJS5_9BILA|nr:unnamed protein product [Didymodactylos carnosus]CAF3526875.1 unnamed protein product [Didymodactylos carnosus]